MVALAATICRGSPARADATACILPSNPALHIRGQVGDEIVPVAGPLLQQEAVRRAPARMGSVVALDGYGTSYQRLYLAVCFSQRPDAVSWPLVESTLAAALRTAVAEGHRQIAVPVFADAPWASPAETLTQAALLMHRCAEKVPEADVLLMAWNEYLHGLLLSTRPPDPASEPVPGPLPEEQETPYLVPAPSDEEQESEAPIAQETDVRLAAVQAVARAVGSAPKTSPRTKGGGSRSRKP